MITRSRLLLSFVSSIALVLGAPALATTNYGTINGTNIDFIDINETSQFGDPEPLFGAPTLTGSGNQLTFFPTSFTASASGASGFDGTGSLLNITLMGASPTDTITDVIIEEFGDFIFAGAGFTTGTNVSVTISGDLTILETIGGAIAPVTISFSTTGDFVPTYSPAGGSYLAPDYGASANSWSGSVAIDVSSFVADATKAELQLNNFLFAFSEAGTSATIQKKVAGAGVVITVIPEPTTAALVLCGLLGLAIRARRS